MSKIEVNAIEPQCGTTLTIGASDTSIAGIGTVNWDTTAKTAAFTAVSGRGYFVDTTSAAITVTLPASPNSGDIVAFKDYANTFDTNNLTLGRNGSPIAGESTDAVISVEGQSGTLIYVDGTKGWMIVNASTDADLPAPLYVTATGGTVTTSGDFKIHTFTGPGTFTVSCVGNAAGSNTVSYMVVAGGGSGGGETPNGYGSGGGGAGGYREGKASSDCYSASPTAATSGLPVTAQGYPITVGAGGSAISAPSTSSGSSGSNSSFSTITSAGGGEGGSGHAPVPGNAAGNGGSGGGAAGSRTNNGSGNTPPVSPSQGNDGGTGANSPYVAGGGGGATAAGTNGNNTTKQAGPGGAGATSSINATPTARAGGGGGSVYLSGPGGDTPSNVSAGAGGTGGGGAGTTTSTAAGSGTTNTGGGGGGAASGFNPCFSSNSGAGGSGIVIIRYKFQN